MRIAIPTYNRPETIKKATLKTLKDIDRSLIDIFVANEEQQQEYRKSIGDDYNIVVGVKGMKNIRNFMIDYYPEGEEVFYFDDDIYGVYKKEGAGLIDIDLSFIDEGFDVLKKTGAELFGVYPVKNHFFMNDEITTNLVYIVGCCYGCINRKDIKMTIDDKEDYERSILYYLKDKKVIRFGGITIKTKYYTEKGGLQSEGMRNWEQVDTSAKYLAEKYPELCKINTSKKKLDKLTKKVLTEIKFISKKTVYLPDITSIQDKLLHELRRISWTKNTARPNISGIDPVKTKEYNDRGDPRHIGKPCLSYTFGYIRPRRTKLGTLELTKISERYATLYELLKEYIKEVAPDFEYTSITANKNIVCEKHTDKYNQKPSLAIGLGDYTGGNLIIKDEIHDIRYKPLIFHGKDEHYNDAFEGERFSLIFYRPKKLYQIL